MAGMAGTQPVLTVPTNLLAEDPVGQYVLMMDESDPSLSLSFTTGVYQMPKSYLVSAHEPDGTGMSRLLLEHRGGGRGSKRGRWQQCDR